MIGTLPKPVQGALWMFGAGLSFQAMAFAGKFLAVHMSPVEIVFVRALGAFLVLLPWVLWQGLGHFRTGRLRMHFFRSLLAYLGMCAWFYALGEIPVADVIALQYTLPLFVVVMAAFILGETVGLRRWLVTLIGFAGALVIIRPGIIEINLAAVMVIVSSIFYAGVNTTTKMLAGTESAMVVVFYMNLLTVPIAFGPAMVEWSYPGWNLVPLMAVVGVTSIAAHLCLTRAMAAADASAVMPVDFVQLPIAACIGWLVFSTWPDIWVWTGALVIFGAAYYLVRFEARHLH